MEALCVSAELGPEHGIEGGGKAWILYGAPSHSLYSLLHAITHLAVAELPVTAKGHVTGQEWLPQHPILLVLSGCSSCPPWTLNGCL